MFVRWKNRMLARNDGSTPAERSLYAVIVKNQRIEGRTQQKVVKYLAHINEGLVDDPLHQSYFWERVEQALEELELDIETQKGIEARLAMVVPRPAKPASQRMAGKELILSGNYSHVSARRGVPLR